MLSLHKLSYLFVLLVDLSLHPLELPVICALHLQHIYIWQTGNLVAISASGRKHAIALEEAP